MANEERWEGGRIRRDARGRPVYVIERMVGGKRYCISTRTHRVSAALEHLKRFEVDPEGYDPRGAVVGERLYLDKALAAGFLGWSGRPLAQGGCANTRSWVGKQRRLLAWWADQLKGRDLRAPRLKIGDIMERLDGPPDAPAPTPDRANKIRVLKTLYTYLRTETHQITAAEDPTLDTLKTPQAAPAQAKRTKVVPLEAIETVIARLAKGWTEEDGTVVLPAPQFAAALTVQAGTGWHTEEVIRFAANGWTEPARQQRAGAPDAAGVLVLPLHKRGDEHRSRVTERVLRAGEQLLRHGSFSRSRYDKAVSKACQVEPQVKPRFTPANMRHTVSTFALEEGAELGQVSTFVGHRSPQTTKRFYATHAAPAKVPTPL